MTEDKKKNKIKTADEAKEGLDFEELVKAGLYFGHKTSSTHPKMKQYIGSSRNRIHIIDLAKTAEKLKEVLDFIGDLVSQGKEILFVGTKIQVKDKIKEVAEECHLPYVNQRWLGGTFTNFETIKKRLEYFRSLEMQKASGELQKYVKKERLKIDREIEGLRKKFGGIKNLEKLPTAVFVTDMKENILVVKEAREKGIIVIAIADTNVNPALADHFIPANDDAISSLNYILDRVKKAILEAKPQPKASQPLADKK